MKYLVYLILLFPLASSAQSHWDQRAWKTETIGFGCGYGGESTTPVHQALRLLFDQNYYTIRQWLFSEKTYEQFLAVFMLEKLKKKKKLILSQAEINQIALIKMSDNKIYVCSGCTYRDEVSLRQLLDKKNKHLIYKSAETWFKMYSKFF